MIPLTHCFFAKLLAIITHHGFYGFRHFPQFNGVVVFSPGVQAAGQGPDTRNAFLLQ